MSRCIFSRLSNLVSSSSSPRKPQIQDIIEDKTRRLTLLEKKQWNSVHSSYSNIWLYVKAFLTSYPQILPGVKWPSQIYAFDSFSLSITLDCKTG